MFYNIGTRLVYVSGNHFLISLKFQVLPFRVGSWPTPQMLDQAGRDLPEVNALAYFGTL
jgi:hypothetical protein